MWGIFKEREGEIDDGWSLVIYIEFVTLFITGVFGWGVDILIIEVFVILLNCLLKFVVVVVMLLLVVICEGIFSWVINLDREVFCILLMDCCECIEMVVEEVVWSGFVKIVVIVVELVSSGIDEIVVVKFIKSGVDEILE